MFSKVLIANRGEIAVRILRACRDLGLLTVAVYSTADRGSLHTTLADESVCIGPPPPADSYLNIPNIISAAQMTGAEAIHPGYGFLAENADFADICEESGLTFIGPDSRTIDIMGNKAEAKDAVKACDIPVVPGSEGPVESLVEARRLSDKVGYPVLLKASAGGGGRGMRSVERGEDLAEAFQTAQREARAAFGDGDLYLEKLLLSPRHIEFQVLSDGRDRHVVFPERECSVQRRHQKLIEESPSPAMSAEAGENLMGHVERLLRHIAYRNAGTLEFLMAEDGRLNFIEMNTRLQVEHPITEAVCGIDLVREQIRIAAGESIDHIEERPKARGHALEFRINAEEPAAGFSPSPGRVERLRWPSGPWVRVDTMVEEGMEILPYYDSLLAKLIVWGSDRLQALQRARRALHELRLDGIATTREFFLEVLDHRGFQSGDYSTGLIAEIMGS